MMLLLGLWREEDGQDLIEYSLLMAFIALVVVAILSSVNHTLYNLWTNISSTVGSVATKGAS